jgi:large subunit ribosomal protein L21e
MVKRTRGMRGGHSRNQLSKHREKTTVTSLLKEFDVGAKVILDIDSSIQGGMPHPRFQGKHATVISIEGKENYAVEIKDGDKKKTLKVNVAHLKAE